MCRDFLRLLALPARRSDQVCGGQGRVRPDVLLRGPSLPGRPDGAQGAATVGAKDSQPSQKTQRPQGAGPTDHEPRLPLRHLPVHGLPWGGSDCRKFCCYESIQSGPRSLAKLSNPGLLGFWDLNIQSERGHTLLLNSSFISSKFSKIIRASKKGGAKSRDKYSNLLVY